MYEQNNYLRSTDSLLIVLAQKQVFSVYGLKRITSVKINIINFIKIINERSRGVSRQVNFTTMLRRLTNKKLLLDNSL